MPAVASAYKQNRLPQLRGFCYAARFKSISKAAEKMFLSQPSVSLQIKALERELGVKLFERRGPRIALTHDGQRLLELAWPLVEAIDGLEKSFTAIRETPQRGSVHIVAGGTTLQYLLPRYVERFTSTYPLADVRLHNRTGKAGLEMLRSGDADFAVGPLVGAPPDITFYPLVTYEPMLITRRDHPLAKRRGATLKDIAKYPLILPPKDLNTHQFVEAVLRNYGLDYDVKLEVGGYDVIKRYVELGLGISIVMSHCLSDRERLHSVPLGRYFPKRTYGVVLYKGRQLSAAAGEFVRMLREDGTRGSPSALKNAPNARRRR
jgi:DNA-binding transcriptional LysR family regulator